MFSFYFSHVFASEIEQRMRIRLIFNGQELRENERSLESYHIFDNCVVHCLLTHMPAPEERAASEAAQQLLAEEDAWDIGHLMMPLLGVILAVLWFFLFKYSLVFSALSCFLIVLFTTGYLLALLVMRRRPPGDENLE